MKKNKSILIIDPVGCKAGMDYYDLNLSEALTNIGYQTYIISNFNSDNKEVINFFKASGNFNILEKSINFFEGFLRSFRFIKILKPSHVIIHAFSYEIKDIIAIGIIKITNAKVILIGHDISSFAKEDSIFIKKIIFNWLANNIIVHNDFSYETLINIVDKKALPKISIIPHGSFLKLPDININREYARKHLGIKSDQKIILFFGQIKKVKGLDILLKAFSNTNKSIHLIIAGNIWKDDFSYYDDIIATLNLKSRITSHVRYIENNEREFFFKCADLLVIPYKEIFQSGVLLMGMSYKIPILASDLKANKEVISHEVNGLIFKSEDPTDMTQKINYFFETPNLKERFIKNAVKTLEKNHSWDTISLKFEKIINL